MYQKTQCSMFAKNFSLNDLVYVLRDISLSSSMRIESLRVVSPVQVTLHLIHVRIRQRMSRGRLGKKTLVALVLVITDFVLTVLQVTLTTCLLLRKREIGPRYVSFTKMIFIGTL